MNIHEYYKPEPQVYLGTASPNFPNYFILNGVRANWGAGTVLPSVCGPLWGLIFSDPVRLTHRTARGRKQLYR